MLDSKKDQIQNEAVEAWKNNNMKGTCEVHTGTRKNLYIL